MKLKDIDSIRIEKGDTLFTQGQIGGIKIRILYGHESDSAESNVASDSQRVWIAMDSHMQEVKQWKMAAYGFVGVTLLCSIVMVLVIFMMIRIKKHFK